MKQTLSLLLILVTAGLAFAEAPKKKAEGAWRALFDGKTTTGWRGYQREDVPPGWAVTDGVLVLTPAPGTTDLITAETFGDFELVVEWQISEGGNSGILFRANEDNEKIWHSAVEIQVLDNDRHLNHKTKEIKEIELEHSAGAVYALWPANREAFNDYGAWNTTRIVAKGTKVRVFLNGKKVATYDTAGEEWKKRVSESKFSKYEGFGAHPKGHIALQAHGSGVKFRVVKIREL